MPLSEKHLKGAFISSRSIFDSDIWKNKPPEYFKTWFYLYGKANHEGNTYSGYYCERGQYFCTYDELNKQLEYFIGARKKKYHGALMKRIMVYLRSASMVTTTKEPRGILVTLTNYDKYQDLNNYENTTESTSEKTSAEPRKNQDRPSINKNDYKNEEELSLINKEGLRPHPQIFTIIPLKFSEKFEVTKSYVDELQAKYKFIDVEHQLLRLRDWSYRNTLKRKTRAEIKISIGRWMTDENIKAQRSGVRHYIPRSAAVGTHEEDNRSPSVHESEIYKPVPGKVYARPLYEELLKLKKKKAQADNFPDVYMSPEEYSRLTELDCADVCIVCGDLMSRRNVKSKVCDECN